MTWIGALGEHDGPYVMALLVHGDEDDMEERAERAWLERVDERPARRRRFPDRVLARYPLTQPNDICARCLAWSGDWDAALELDHIVELARGGIDHPANLVRLCSRCHSEKPTPQAGVPSEVARDAVIAWVRRGR